MTETPRPRPRRGVLGYAAELEQFDPVPSYVDELTPPEPPTAILPAPVPPAPVAPWTRTAPAPIVSHIRQQRRRRSRAAILGLLLPPGPALPGAEPVAGRTTTEPVVAPTVPAGGAVTFSRTAGRAAVRVHDRRQPLRLTPARPARCHGADRGSAT